MKKVTVVIGFIFLSAGLLANANDAYLKAMQAKIAQFKKATSIEELQASANAFERIAKKETQEWLPLYYAGHCYIKMAFNDKLSLTEKDAYFDIAVNLTEKAAEISTNNSEITALKGYALMGKLSADAATRGQSLSPVVMQLFGKAIAQNQENPRALFLMAQMKYGMAQFFGSGTEEACALNQKSLVIFENETDRGILPGWGYESAKSFSTQCK